MQETAVWGVEPHFCWLCIGKSDGAPTIGWIGYNGNVYGMRKAGVVDCDSGRKGAGVEHHRTPFAMDAVVAYRAHVQLILAVWRQRLEGVCRLLHGDGNAGIRGEPFESVFHLPTIGVKTGGPTCLISRNKAVAVDAGGACVYRY